MNMIVVARNNSIPSGVTSGERYKVLCQTPYSYLIKVDDAKTLWFSKILFLTQEEFRDEKINKILEDDSCI